LPTIPSSCRERAIQPSAVVDVLYVEQDVALAGEQLSEGGLASLDLGARQTE
jgi:hypothetical protein